MKDDQGNDVIWWNTEIIGDRSVGELQRYYDKRQADADAATEDCERILEELLKRTATTTDKEQGT
jgi:hypothetical protein